MQSQHPAPGGSVRHAPGPFRATRLVPTYFLVTPAQLTITIRAVNDNDCFVQHIIAPSDRKLWSLESRRRNFERVLEAANAFAKKYARHCECLSSFRLFLPDRCDVCKKRSECSSWMREWKGDHEQADHDYIEKPRTYTFDKTHRGLDGTPDFHSRNYQVRNNWMDWREGDSQPLKKFQSAYCRHCDVVHRHEVEWCSDSWPSDPVNAESGREKPWTDDLPWYRLDNKLVAESFKPLHGCGGLDRLRDYELGTVEVIDDLEEKHKRPELLVTHSVLYELVPQYDPPQRWREVMSAFDESADWSKQEPHEVLSGNTECSTCGWERRYHAGVDGSGPSNKPTINDNTGVCTAFVGPRRLTHYTRTVSKKNRTPFPYVWGLRGRRVARDDEAKRPEQPAEKQNDSSWEQVLRQHRLSTDEGRSHRLAYGWEYYRDTEPDTEPVEKTPEEDQTPPDVIVPRDDTPIEFGPDLEPVEISRPGKRLLSDIQIKDWELRMAGVKQGQRAKKLKRDVRQIRRIGEKAQWALALEQQRRFLEEQKS